jgi:hypothetical protein
MDNGVFISDYTGKFQLQFMLRDEEFRVDIGMNSNLRLLPRMRLATKFLLRPNSISSMEFELSEQNIEDIIALIQQYKYRIEYNLKHVYHSNSSPLWANNPIEDLTARHDLHKSIFFECDCHSFHHALCVSHWKFDLAFSDDAPCYISMMCHNFMGIFDRVKSSAKYAVSGGAREFGHWGGWNMREKDADRLIAVLEASLAEMEKAKTYKEKEENEEAN